MLSGRIPFLIIIIASLQWKVELKSKSLGGMHRVHYTQCKNAKMGKSKIELTGAVCAVGGRSVEVRWWSARSAAAQQVCWCHWRSVPAALSGCGKRSSHTGPWSAPWPPPHTAHPACNKLNFRWTCIRSFHCSSDNSRFLHLGCYLSLCEIEHSDEAKHFIWVIVIAVLWHLSLLEESEGMRRSGTDGSTVKLETWIKVMSNSPWWHFQRGSVGWWCPSSLTCLHEP